MRDTFLDISTGHPFNGDPPYIFRFEEGQSIGLNYIRKICMVSDSPTATIRTEPDQDIFRILRMTQDIPNDMQTIKLNLKMYADLDYLIAPDNRWGYNPNPPSPTNPDGDPLSVCEGYQFDLAYDDQGNPTAQAYLYMFYILGRAEEPGEYFGKLWINEKEYRILADFYAENEVLKENLKNFESRLPESIQKAIYESNVHEDLNDNILINRKNKELLMQYMSIMGNKGSYESLLNSVNWFEWGELLRLEEFWKRYVNDDLDYDYFATALNHAMTPEDIQQLTNHIKSTYIGLYCTLNRLRYVGGRMVYQDSFGRTNILSQTSWVDSDTAAFSHVPDDLYDEYPELDPANFIPGAEDPPGAEAAEIGTEIVLPDDEFSSWTPGTMVTGTPVAGNWVEVDLGDGTHKWIEITQGMIDTQTVPQGTYWDISFNYIYNEQMPNMLRVLALWTGQDLSLKMTVLGNFLSSFFMPIHLDLIHSCIEYWVFGYALKQIYTQSVDEKGWKIAIGGIDMVWDSTLKIAPHPETMCYIDTLFRNYNTEDVFGFSTDASRHEAIMSAASSDDRKLHNTDVLVYLYKGESCPVHFAGKIYSGSTDPNIRIHRQRLVWYRDGGSDRLIRDDISSWHEYHYFRYYADPSDPNSYVLITNDNISDIRLDEPPTYTLSGGTYVEDETPAYEIGHYYLKYSYAEINDSNRSRLLTYDPTAYDSNTMIPNDGYTYSRNCGAIDSGVAIYPSENIYVEDSIRAYDYGHYYKDDTGQYNPITFDNKQEIERSGVPTYSVNMNFDLDFMVGFKREGSYVIYLEFYDTNNRIYTKKFSFDISDSMSNRVDVMKLVPTDVLTWSGQEAPISLYQYAEVGELSEEFTDDDVSLQSHFFSAGSDGDPLKAGLNHTLIGIVEENYKFDGDTTFDSDMDKTLWVDGTGVDVAGADASGGSWEGDTVVWTNDLGATPIVRAKWEHAATETGANKIEDWDDPNDPGYIYWSGKWPFPDDEFSKEKSIAMDGVNVPDTPLSGILNDLVSRLETAFSDYWWSWDEIQISKRDGIRVKSNSFDPWPKGNEIYKQYPDEYPYQ